LNESPKTQANTLAACTPLTADNPSTWWYENITHNGQASFMASSYKANYQVFRNVVTQFGADNTGSKDASGAIQNAINGSNSPPDHFHDRSLTP
jgi:glucan 1,3-beta-glucosidase